MPRRVRAWRRVQEALGSGEWSLEGRSLPRSQDGWAGGGDSAEGDQRHLFLPVASVLTAGVGARNLGHLRIPVVADVVRLPT